MGVQKRIDKNTGKVSWDAFVYLPKAMRKPDESPKRYIGRYPKHGIAVQAFEDAKRALRGKPPVQEMTVSEYAERWLEFKHGPDTRRPRPGTLKTNRQSLKPFLQDYGEHTLDGIPRNEALDWCLKYRSSAKAVSAMFNDAVNDSLIKTNPFQNRQHKQMRGRKDITPLTEEEVDLLASLAVEIWGDAYGKVCKAWILFSAWVGTRPGETFNLRWDDIDLKAGTVRVKRIKPPYNEDVVPVARRALEALLDMPGAREGWLFKTVTGRRVSRHGGYAWYWDKVRLLFEQQIDPERRDALREDDKPFALYSMRHFCASVIVARGGNEYDCAFQLGNTPEVCRETYIHEFKLERQERLRNLIDGAEVRPLRAVREDSA